jgi:hypothetical protein
MRRTGWLVLVSVLVLGGCAATKFDVQQGDVITQRLVIQDVSQDTLTLEFRSPTGTFQRRLICDKWDQVCMEQGHP